MRREDTGRGKATTLQKLAPALIVGAGTLWGLLGLFVNAFADAGLSSLNIIEIRSFGCTVLVLLFLLVYQRGLLKIRLRDLWCFLGTGLLSLLLFNICYFTTIQLSSMSVAAVLLYTSPAFVMLMSRVLFKERITRKKLVSLAMVLVGTVLVSGILTGGAPLSPLSFLVGIGAGVGYALYSIFSRYALNRGYHSFTIVFYTHAICAIGIIPLVDLSACAVCITSSVTFLMLAVFLGLTTALSYVFYTLGLTQVENSKASIMVAIEPVVATLSGFLFLDEVPTASTLAGMALVIGAIVLLNAAPSEKPAGNS